MSLAGINVSQFNGAVNWRAAANSISFGYAKVTQGTEYIDPRFAQNWKNMKLAGVPRGAFHFFNPRKPGTEQAELFLRKVPIDSADLPPMLDLEWQNGVSATATLSGVHAWLRCVQAETGRTPLLYTSASFWNRLGNPSKPRNSPLWVAHHAAQMPNLPTAWNNWTFWQFTREGRCSGVQGYVDLNRFSGSLEDLTGL